jgi:hypothetical protein
MPNSHYGCRPQVVEDHRHQRGLMVEPIDPDPILPIGGWGGEE